MNSDDLADVIREFCAQTGLSTKLAPRRKFMDVSDPANQAKLQERLDELGDRGR